MLCNFFDSIADFVGIAEYHEHSQEHKQEEHIELQRMCICNIFSRDKLSGEISRSADEIPECLEKMRIPHIGNVKVLQKESLDRRNT